jgi:hypothetical protein
MTDEPCYVPDMREVHWYLHNCDGRDVVHEGSQPGATVQLGRVPSI